MTDWLELTNDDIYTDDQVRPRLAKQLPHWQLQQGCLVRRYRTHDWKVSLMVVNAIGHLAEAAFHHPDLELSYAGVVVKLTTHSAGGITNKDFALAEKIEQFVQWQPGRQHDGSEGTDDATGQAYIIYD